MSDSIMEIFYYAIFECNGYYGRKCAQIINNDERNENFWKRDLTKTQNQNYLSNIEDEEKACHDFPCENGGKCLKFQTKHYCKCSRGYIGKKCEISTCKNECINGVCSYHNSCICREGFKGSMCEISDCSENESNVCLNAGFCYKYNSKIRCKCLNNTSGLRCEKLLSNLNCFKVSQKLKISNILGPYNITEKKMHTKICESSVKYLPNLKGRLSLVYEMGVIILVSIFIILLKLITTTIISKHFISCIYFNFIKNKRCSQF
uniref:Neurogenic locus notch homolog protein 3 (Trinotate prediction) n=1 Tax=Henneguya salminicola TaxID=69463 RepID=A0A6G3ME25_HENSL